MTARLIIGDVHEVLATLPDNSVDLVVTSPPFLALRSYLPADHPDKSKEIGSEPTPGEFIDALLDVTEALDRVVAPHGSICIELGDTYSGSGGAGGDYGDQGLRDGQPKFEGSGRRNRPADVAPGILAPTKRPGPEGRDQIPGWPLAKSLCLIPELYRIALVYGFNPLTGRETPRWRARNVVRWHRPNPPVGALGDKFRPATSEMVVLCKSRTRYFDLDAVRSPAREDKIPGPEGWKDSGARPSSLETGRERFAARLDTHGGMAPPLDTWIIPTAPYFTPEGLLVVPSGRTSHRIRVPLGAHADGIQRTMSPDCPAHGSEDQSGPTPSGGGHGDGSSSHNERTDSRLASERQLDSAPTSQTTEPSESSLPWSSEGEVVAMSHNTASNRRGLDPETTTPGTPSVQTNLRTADTSGSPGSSELGPDNSENRTSEGGSPGSRESRTTARTADIGTRPVSSSACTCSYWIEMDVATESTSDYASFPPDTWTIPTAPFRGSHYATFPPALVTKPILSMCPERVCRTCGEPSRRIVEASYVGSKSGKPYEPHVWASGIADKAAHSNKAPDEGAVRLTETTGWTDCGHDDYRPGVVLDPFAGSGTTLAVATGHGRDALGIDLDKRNAELCRERVGMFLEVVEPVMEVPA